MYNQGARAMTFTRKSLATLAILATLVFAAGCANTGKVEQGRAIAFDKQKGVVTLILDSAPKSDQPKYDVLPPVAVTLPLNPDETGPAPAAAGSSGRKGRPQPRSAPATGAPVASRAGPCAGQPHVRHLLLPSRHARPGHRALSARGSGSSHFCLGALRSGRGLVPPLQYAGSHPRLSPLPGA